jgi:hypothetical protein
VALWLLPYRVWARGVVTFRRFSSRLTPSDSTPEDVAYVVARVSRRVAYASCLTQALATWLLLRPSEHKARLQLGVRRSPAGGLEAHAWIETDAGVLSGDVEACRYAPLARWQQPAPTPSSRPRWSAGLH